MTTTKTAPTQAGIVVSTAIVAGIGGDIPGERNQHAEAVVGHKPPHSLRCTPGFGQPDHEGRSTPLCGPAAGAQTALNPFSPRTRSPR
jgi:hypothetical protein